MRPALAITHLAAPQLGLVAEVFAERGIGLRRVRMERGEAPGRLDGVSAVVTFGGLMGVPDAERHSFLRDELGLLERALDRGVPVLGLCLGAQLLATAAGGEVTRMAGRHIAWEELVRLPAADGDPLFGALPERLPVLEWHLDAIAAPPAAPVPAETAGPGCSAFRAGEVAWGSQIHLELTPEMIEAWLADPAVLEELADTGIDPRRFAAETLARLPQQMAGARDVLARFAELVAARDGEAGAPREGGGAAWAARAAAGRTAR